MILIDTILMETRASAFKAFAVEGMVASGAKGIAPDVGQGDTDPDWQPM